MRLVWQLLVIAVVAVAGGQATVAFQDNSWLAFGLGAVTVALSVLAYRWVVAKTERREVTELAREGAVSKTLWGTLTGVIMFSLVIANLAFLGYYHVDGLGAPGAIVGWAGVMATAAMTEELLFRGVLLRVIESWTGSAIALALTGLVFGLSHIMNPNATLWGALAIAVEAGFMLGAAYIATRNLWVPIGIHFGWNFATSAIFSTQVSGNDAPQGLLDASTSGPMLVSGGDFGPEGSLFAVAFGTLLTIGFLWYAKRHDRIVPMRRRTARIGDTATLPR